MENLHNTIIILTIHSMVLLELTDTAPKKLTFDVELLLDALQFQHCQDELVSLSAHKSYNHYEENEVELALPEKCKIRLFVKKNKFF